MKGETMAIRALRNKIHPAIGNELGGTLNEHELGALSSLSTLVELPDGKRFATQGSVGQEAVVIVEGHAAVMRDNEQIAIATKGDFLGEMSLMFNAPRNATLVAQGPVVLAVLNRREFHSLMDLCPRLRQLVETEAAKRKA